jgi:exodeoxyribonuclease-3
MKIISWNVNGIRAALNKGFLEFLEKHNPDAICLQEIKANRDQVDYDFDKYNEFWNSAEKKGYSGTAVFTKERPTDSKLGIGIPEHDTEGRVTTVELEKYYIVSVYVPNSKDDLSRLQYRQKWDEDFLTYIRFLDKDKPVIFCGDFNVAHQPIDLARPKQNEGEHGYTKEEREGFQSFINAGFVDTFRLLNKESEQYSWWSYFGGARKRNVGWRIDYVMASERIAKDIKEVFILPEVTGSDHCPVGIVIE